MILPANPASRGRAATAAAEAPAVRFRDVVKTYDDDGLKVTAVRGVSFDVAPRRFAMIVGPSGSGEKQRVAIARARINEPELVLADEPTANLDTQTGASIIELMRQVQREQKTTFIFSTHDPQLISHAEDTYVIRDGELVDHRQEGA